MNSCSSHSPFLSLALAHHTLNKHEGIYFSILTNITRQGHWCNFYSVYLLTLNPKNYIDQMNEQQVFQLFHFSLLNSSISIQWPEIPNSKFGGPKWQILVGIVRTTTEKITLLAHEKFHNGECERVHVEWKKKKIIARQSWVAENREKNQGERDR